MDFKKAAELLSLCKEYNKPISQIMMDRECEMTEKPLDEIRSRMAVSLQIMKDATKEAINQPSQSMGGLIGGESRKLSDLQSSGKNIAGNLISKAIAYSMGVLESMLPWAHRWPHRQPAHPVLFQVSFWHFRKNMISPMTRSSTHSSHVLPLAILPCSMQPLPVPSADVRPKSALLPQWPLPLLSS